MSIAIHWRRPWPERADLDAHPAHASITGDFVDRVRARTGVSSRQEAERIAGATLRCLLARLSEPVRLRVLNELPAGLARDLRQHPAAGSRFEPPERYFEQVALEVEREPVAATPLALAVAKAFADSLPESLLSEVAAEVPGVFQALVPERACLAHLPPAGRLGSEAVIPLFMAPTTTPSYLGLAWRSSSQKV